MPLVVRYEYNIKTIIVSSKIITIKYKKCVRISEVNSEWV